MAGRQHRAFVAYPGTPHDLAGPITAATEKIGRDGGDVVAWPAMESFGAHIPTEVRNNIEAANTLFADVTRPNLNVYFEVGYAIGLGKTFAPIINTSFADAARSVSSLGLFENIGHRQYENSEQLASIIITTPVNSLLDLYAVNINHSQPLYLLDTFRKTDFRNAVVSAIKSFRSHYRSFDPVESPRISLVQLVEEISSSSGVIVPFLASHIDDADRHNLRGALIAGLALGLGRETLVITDQRDETGPVDYNEKIIVARDQSRISERVTALCSEAVIAAQDIPLIVKREDRSVLQNLSLGASAAENEFRDLGSYFVETAEYLRAARGEVSIITGRKGSGKSAIFFQVRDSGRRRKGSLNVDLKPDSHQLTIFREQILSTVGAGFFEHTVAAFWYFVILSEMLLNVYRRLESAARFDGTLLGPMRVIEEVFEEYSILEPGDFTTRLSRLSKIVARELQNISRGRKTVSIGEVTNIVFRSGITRIRDLIVENTSRRVPITFLFDNIDKGWPPTGVEPGDITIVRLLIETLEKVRNDLASRDRELHSIVFIRHDIYDLMMDQTPDRGKSGQVSIDWTDRAKLAQVIYKRLQVGLGDRRSTMLELWHRIFPRQIGTKGSFDWFVDHCLMRPRFLIDLIENAVANAINRGRRSVEQEDCLDAVRQHSLSLVDDFGFEMRDVSGVPSEILYSLIGCPSKETRSSIIARFVASGIGTDIAEKALSLMFWYGLVGIEGEGIGRFIFDYRYNMRRLQAELAQQGADPVLVINPGLHVGLVS